MPNSKNSGANVDATAALQQLLALVSADPSALQKMMDAANNTDEQDEQDAGPEYAYVESGKKGDYVQMLKNDEQVAHMRIRFFTESMQQILEQADLQPAQPYGYGFRFNCARGRYAMQIETAVSDKVRKQIETELLAVDGPAKNSSSTERKGRTVARASGPVKKSAAKSSTKSAAKSNEDQDFGNRSYDPDGAAECAAEIMEEHDYLDLDKKEQRAVNAEIKDAVNESYCTEEGKDYSASGHFHIRERAKELLA